jgi:hypothetical protein
MSLLFYTGYRKQGWYRQVHYANVLGWAPDSDINVLKITGPRDEYPQAVNEAHGPEFPPGNLWDNNLSMLDPRDSMVFVCTRLNGMLTTHGSTSVSDIGIDGDPQGQPLPYFTVACNNDWKMGTTLLFLIVKGLAPKE